MGRSRDETTDSPRPRQPEHLSRIPLGVYDLGGNVWEWCFDLYKPGSRWGVLRGGSWANKQRAELLTSYRNVVDRGERDVIYGFRCVLVSEPD